jgi:hypothetical protein
MIQYSVVTVNVLGDKEEKEFPLYREARVYWEQMANDKDTKYTSLYDQHGRELVGWFCD